MVRVHSGLPFNNHQNIQALCLRLSSRYQSRPCLTANQFRQIGSSILFLDNGITVFYFCMNSVE